MYGDVLHTAMSHEWDLVYDVEREYVRSLREMGGELIASKDPCRDIRKRRVSIGMTQEELGKLVDLRRETISRIENGSISATIAFIRKFVKTVAVAKVVRDLHALSEVRRMEGKEITPLPPNILRLSLGISLDELNEIKTIGVRGYQKSRTRIIKSIK